MSQRLPVTSIVMVLAAVLCAPCNSKEPHDENVRWDSTSECSGSMPVAVTIRPLSEGTSPVLRPWEEVLLHEDFENGAPGWITESLWHLETYRSATGEYSMAYNTGEPDYNYDVGTSYARLISPPMDLSHIYCCRIVINSWMQTEMDHPFFMDLAFILVDEDGDGNFGPITGDLATSYPQSQWIEISAEHCIVDHDAPAFRVGFLFTADGEDNSYEGWYIDDFWLIDEAVSVESSSWGNIKALYFE